MNILYHHRTQGKGGEGVHIREVIKALESLGHKVFVVSPPGVDVFAEDKKNESVIPKRSRLTGVWLWISKHTPQIVFELFEICYNVIAAKNIKNVLKKEKIDFIYERYAFFLWVGTSLARRHNIPFILEVNEISGIKRQRGQVLVGLANAIEKKIFKKADAIAAVSSFLKNEIVKRGVSVDKIHIVPNAVDITRFDPSVSGTRVRQSLGLNGKAVLGFVGHFSNWDRLDKFVEIFGEVIAERPNAHLLLVGDARNRSGREALGQLIKDKRLSESVSLSGKIDRKDIPEYLSAIDICVIPSSNPFGSPLVLFEYMAMGKVVVAPNVAPVTDILENGINGVVFRSDDNDALKKSIIDLIDNKNKRIQIGLAARERVVGKHLWRHNAEKVISINRGLAKC